MSGLTLKEKIDIMSGLTLKEKIDIMQAAEDGATIEFKTNWQTEWDVIEKPDWDWFHCEYRVKREPRKVYFACDAADLIDFRKAYRADGLADLLKRNPGVKFIEFVEVLSNDESPDL